MTAEASEPAAAPRRAAGGAVDVRPVTEQVFSLPNFRGPLDLLLHLVREQELEITEVDLARLCDQYLSALEVMRQLDIDVAGEFLVVASTLMLIKSRTLLPREDVDLAEELDPADELITQLLEYRKFKTLSLELGRRADDRSRRMPRGGRDLPPDEERELAEIGVWDLVGSFARLVEELDLGRRFDTLVRQKALGEYLREVVARLSDGRQWSFRDLVLGTAGRDHVFGVFLSMLELCRLGQIVVEQRRTGEEIRLRLDPDRDESRLTPLLEAAIVTTRLEAPRAPEPAAATPTRAATPAEDADVVDASAAGAEAGLGAPDDARSDATAAAEASAVPGAGPVRDSEPRQP